MSCNVRIRNWNYFLNLSKQQKMLSLITLQIQNSVIESNEGLNNKLESINGKVTNLNSQPVLYSINKDKSFEF